MTSLQALDVVLQRYSAKDGATVHDALVARLDRGESVWLSFAGVDVTTTFINTALVPLLDWVGPAALRERLVVRDLRRTVAALLRQRLAFETRRRAGTDG